MGSPTAFLEIPRDGGHRRPVDERLNDLGEVVVPEGEDPTRAQASRCMGCGVPFCTQGCPLGNPIPDFNGHIAAGRWKEAFLALSSTNPFPEFTGRICPAPCEAACTLNINTDAVGIKSIEHAIIDKAWEEGWVVPQPAEVKTGKKVAVVGSGPAGLAAAQQLARAGHDVTVFEKNDRIGGLLRYGIPDFKMEKSLIDRRVEQLQAEGVVFRTGVLVGAQNVPAGIVNDAKQVVSAEQLKQDFDAVVLAGGSEIPRDLPVPGRELGGVHYALEFLIPQNKQVAGDKPNPISAKGKHVVVIGGGDTGSDCVGTSNRHGAASVTQFELMPMPPEQENKALTWPYWPTKLRTSSSHEEGCERDFAVATKEFIGKNGKVKALKACRLEFKDGKMSEVPGSEFEIKADLVLFAMGFTQPVGGVLEAFGVDKDARGNAKASTDGAGSYTTNVPKVFAAGDMRRGQSLVVWAIREGRQCARAVDEFLMGESLLPR